MTKVIDTPAKHYGSNHIIYECQGCKAYYTAALPDIHNVTAKL